jgi:hypothetical protein
MELENLAPIMQTELDRRGDSRRKYTRKILFQHYYQRVGEQAHKKGPNVERPNTLSALVPVRQKSLNGPNLFLDLPPFGQIWCKQQSGSTQDTYCTSMLQHRLILAKTQRQSLPLCPMKLQLLIQSYLLRPASMIIARFSPETLYLTESIARTPHHHHQKLASSNGLSGRLPKHLPSEDGRHLPSQEP